MPIHKLYPHRTEVIRVLGEAVGDHKRAVRKAAVRCRNEWFLISTTAVVS